VLICEITKLIDGNLGFGGYWYDLHS
jgi:hypothetical protein